MITRDYLLARAEAARAQRSAAALPAGTAQTSEYLAARDDEETCLRAVRWLDDMGITSREQIGCLGGKPVHKGDKVRIKAGSVITSMNPRYTRQDPKVAKRAYQVTVYRVDAGSLNSHWHPHKVAEAARDQQICWAGDGGYWCYVSTSDIEVI